MGFSTEATLTMWEALLAFTQRAVLQLLAAGALAVKAIAVQRGKIGKERAFPTAGRSDLSRVGQ
jgi:protein-arginine kinase